MNKSLLLLVAAGVVYYLYEQSQKGATNNPNCLYPEVFVNGQCIPPPTSSSGNTQLPCAPGYTNVDGTGCVANPGTIVSVDPIGDLLNQLI